MTLSRTAAIHGVAPETRSKPAGIAHGDPATIAEISAGLLAQQASTSPKYFYDSLGSHLFEAICELPEYYPTRTEASIFAQHGADIGIPRCLAPCQSTRVAPQQRQILSNEL